MNKNIIWVTFNFDGSVCSVMHTNPGCEFDQWDKPWVEMTTTL